MPDSVLRGLAIAAMLAAACPALGAIVETGRAQCCSSINPQMPPPTYYGAAMLRENDPRGAWTPHLAVPADPPGTIEELQRRVDEQEQADGPMAASLVQPLSGLAAAYLASDRYRDAISALRRGIHLARINGGLHTPDQVDMLEQLILTMIRQGDYAAADQQQDYLYRVKRWRKTHGSGDTLQATMRYADWMRGSYLADVDRQRFPRLVGLNDLYNEAIQEIEAAEGKDSPSLLPYLEGRADLSYLISVYPGEREGAFSIGAQASTDFSMAGEAQIRFWRMRDHNFRYGLEALKRKADILRTQNHSRQEIADSVLAIADWYQWHRRYAEAIRTYREAWGLMEQEESAVAWRTANLAAPLELPKNTVFNPGLIPLGIPNAAAISVRFDVNRHGEAKDIEVLTKTTEETEAAVTRAYHYLRNVRFRPGMKEGKVVRTEGVERTYNIRF